MVNGSVPASLSRVAKVCLRSCNRKFSIPARLASVVNADDSVFGEMENTFPLLINCSRALSTSATALLIGTERSRPLFVFLTTITFRSQLMSDHPRLRISPRRIPVFTAKMKIGLCCSHSDQSLLQAASLARQE